MKILQLISSGGFYGAESVLINLSVELERLGHHCIVGAFENSANRNTEIADRASQVRLTVAPIPCNGQLDRGAAKRIRNIVEQESIDIVHSHGYKANFYALMARNRNGVPISATCHNWLGTAFSSRLYGSLDRYLLRFFDGIAAVSQPVADQLVEAGVRKEIKVIPNGVTSFVGLENAANLRSEFGEPGKVIVGSVGRLSSEKGTTFFVEAAAEICQELSNVNFVQVGDGPSREELETQIRRLGIERRFMLAGQRSDMAQVYRSFDIFVLPSLTEGMPMALLEAMSAGLPVIATKVGAVQRILDRPDFGILVPPGDAGALASAIRDIVLNPAKRTSLGHNAERRIEEKFSAAAMASQYVDLYREILLRNGSSESAKQFSTNNATLRN